MGQIAAIHKSQFSSDWWALHRIITPVPTVRLALGRPWVSSSSEVRLTKPPRKIHKALSIGKIGIKALSFQRVRDRFGFRSSRMDLSRFDLYMAACLFFPESQRIQSIGLSSQCMVHALKPTSSLYRSKKLVNLL